MNIKELFKLALINPSKIAEKENEIDFKKLISLFLAYLIISSVEFHLTPDSFFQSLYSYSIDIASKSFADLLAMKFIMLIFQIFIFSLFFNFLFLFLNKRKFILRIFLIIIANLSLVYLLIASKGIAILNLAILFLLTIAIIASAYINKNIYISCLKFIMALIPIHILSSIFAIISITFNSEKIYSLSEIIFALWFLIALSSIMRKRFQLAIYKTILILLLSSINTILIVYILKNIGIISQTLFYSVLLYS